MDKNKIDFVEQFKVLINRVNKVFGIYDFFTGGVSGTVADPKIIFAAALKANCSSIIISHNHPASDLKPSCQNEELTNKIKQAGNLLDIKLFDHETITI